MGSKVQGGDTALEAMAGIPDGIPVEIQNKETTPWSGKGGRREIAAVLECPSCVPRCPGGGGHQVT